MASETRPCLRKVQAAVVVTMPGKDQPQSLADPRLKAILQLSGQGTDQQGLHKDSWKDIRIPMMCVTGSLDRAAQGQEPLWRREPENDAQAKKFLESDALAKLSDGKAKLERR